MNKVTVRVEEKHSCGQVFETIMHMEANEAFSLSLSTELPHIPDVSTFTLPKESPRKLDLTGHIEKTEIHGMALKDHRLVCQGCGADLMFPQEQETASTAPSCSGLISPIVQFDTIIGYTCDECGASCGLDDEFVHGEVQHE